MCQISSDSETFWMEAAGTRRKYALDHFTPKTFK